MVHLAEFFQYRVEPGAFVRYQLREGVFRPQLEKLRFLEAD